MGPPYGRFFGSIKICLPYQQSGLSVLKFTLNYKKIKLYICWQKIWANQESSLTTVWLKQDPPVYICIVIQGKTNES